MENYIVILLLSVVVLLSAVYVYNVEQRIANADRKFRNEIVELKDKFVISEGKHKHEMEEMKEELKTKSKAIHEQTSAFRKESEDIKLKLQEKDTERIVNVERKLRNEMEELKEKFVIAEGKHIIEMEVMKEEFKLKSKSIHEQTNEKFEDIKLKLQNTVCRDEISEMKHNMTVLLKETNTRYDKAIQVFKKENAKTAFFVTMEDVHEDFTTNTILRLTGIKTNIGDGYHSGTGKFTGLYEFNASFIINGAVPLELNLIKNGEVIARGHACLTHGDTGTINAILLLQEGDKVYLRHPRSFGSIYGLKYSMFSGHQL